MLKRKSAGRRGQRGFSMLETLISRSIFSVVLLGLHKLTIPLIEHVKKLTYTYRLADGTETRNPSSPVDIQEIILNIETGLRPGWGLDDRSIVTSTSVQTTFVFTDSSLDIASQVFDFAFESHSEGRTGAFGRRRTMTEGIMRLSASRGNFADYLIFTDVHSMPDGSPVWFHSSGNFDGRVHTNDALRFAFNPAFRDLVTSVGQTATYFNWGARVELDADRNGSMDAPDFYGGFDRDVPRIELPDNSFSQQRAAIGGNPSDTKPVTEYEIRKRLNITEGGSDEIPVGVYVASEGGKAVGGIYIQGEAQSLTMSVKKQHIQVYDIVDQNGQTWHVEVDEKKRSTKIRGPGKGRQLRGVPRGVIYTNGAISELKGPSRSGSTVRPALQKDTPLHIVSTRDIAIQGDLAYQDYDHGEKVPGLFSSGGDIRIGKSAPADLQVDAVVLASKYMKSFTVDDYDIGSYRGMVHLRGGMITNYYGAFGLLTFAGMRGYGRDFRYDRRGKVPPYFPLTNRYVPSGPDGGPHLKRRDESRRRWRSNDRHSGFCRDEIRALLPRQAGHVALKVTSPHPTALAHAPWGGVARRRPGRNVSGGEPRWLNGQEDYWDSQTLPKYRVEFIHRLSN